MLGRRIILGSSFPGGPRNLQQLYQDGMAIVRKLGQSPHALDIVRTEAKKIADNRQNRAGVLISVLSDFDIATYTPPVKTVFRLIDEEY